MALKNSKASLRRIYITDVQVRINGLSHLLSFLSEDAGIFRSIGIENFLVSDTQCLRTLLQLLLRVPPEITLYVKADVENIAPEDVKTVLCDFLNEIKCIKRNISLSLVNLSKKMKVEDERSLNSLAMKKKFLKNLYIDTKKGTITRNI